MPSSNYDNAAWFYDQLSQLVYGKALLNAQRFLLPFINVKSNILIVGGGTGWILEELTRLHPSGLTITYVELSEKMMTRSKAKYIGNNQVTYINKAIQDADLTNSFDVVITPFLLDNFEGSTLLKIFTAIHHRLKPDGLWLNTDFQQTGQWWHYLMLKSMLLFFKLICKVQASSLANIGILFSDYEVIDKKTFFGNFIKSTAYIKKRVDSFKCQTPTIASMLIYPA